jgi:hypothetical protein
MNVDFRCEHCGKLLSAPAHANEPVRCPHCQKLTAVPAGLASLPRPKVQGEEAAQPASAALPGEGNQEESQGLPSGGELAGVLETMMPFVISLFFHLGLVLVTVFWVTRMSGQRERPKEIVVPGYVLPGEEEGDSGGTLTPPPNPTAGGGGGGSRYSKVTESSARSGIIASGGGGSGDAREGLAVIGIGTAVGGHGTGTGTGKGPGWFSGGGGGGQLFGLGPGRGGGRGVPRHYVYVVDRSGSMLHTFDAVKHEMMSSIGQLDAARGQEFHVILFADGPPHEAEAKRLVPATPDFQGRATTWLKDQFAKGTTDPIPALTRAFEVLERVDSPGGKVIFLLTDSLFPDNQKVIDLCRARNTKKDVHIFTFLYGDRPKEAEETMRKIAAEHGGQYKFVSAEE